VSRRASAALFVVYVIVLGFLTLTPSSDTNPLRQNWIPLQSTWPTLVNLWIIVRHPEYLRYVDDGGLIQIVGNLLLFIPFGWLVPQIHPKLRPTLRVVALAALVSFMIEVSQLLFIPSRMASIDDVILNTLSAFIGIESAGIVWPRVERLWPIKSSAR
jgi:glycopeptide antibiotics resistance protein